MGQDSSGYGLEARGIRIRFPVGARDSSLLHTVQAENKAYQVFYPMGNRESFRMIKRRGRKANHSSPSRTEVRNTWIYTSTSSYIFMALYVIKFWDIFFDSPH
jgi:hypothetical protein